MFLFMTPNGSKKIIPQLQLMYLVLSDYCQQLSYLQLSELK